MSGKDVKSPLKPISTTTSDEEISQTTNPESRPRSKIYAFVDLRFTVFPNTSEVLFEIGRPAQHE
jgi:hypothetical protein